MVRPRRRHGLRLRSLFLWHRYLGLTAALFVLALAVTGLLINYSDDLNLDRRHVKTDWLLDWYGIPPPAVIVGYPVAGHWVSQVGERLYFDDQELDREAAPLHGAVQTGEGMAVAGGDQLLLLTPEGRVIDRLGTLEGLPADVEALGLAAGQPVVRTPQGAYQGDAVTLEWAAVDPKEVAWATGAPLPDALRRSLVQDYRGAGISWERVMLDLHSGRLFGGIGVAIVDISSVLMALLAVTGLLHFSRRKRR